MIFQLNITILWKYCDADGALERDGAFEYTNHFTGSDRQLRTYLKQYDGIELIRCIADGRHDPYFAVIHEIQVS